MTTLTTPFRIYIAHGGPKVARLAIQGIWMAACNVIPLVHRFELQGVGMVLDEPRGDVCFRFAANMDAGFFACEGFDAVENDRWEAFVVAWPDGIVSTGWRRCGRLHEEAPDIWVAGAVEIPFDHNAPVLVPSPTQSLLNGEAEHLVMADAILIARTADEARAFAAHAVQPTQALAGLQPEHV